MVTVSCSWQYHRAEGRPDILRLRRNAARKRERLRQVAVAGAVMLDRSNLIDTNLVGEGLFRSRRVSRAASSSRLVAPVFNVAQ